MAERNGDQVLEAQYLFEEACAKALFNLSYPSAPFDPDSPYLTGSFRMLWRWHATCASTRAES